MRPPAVSYGAADLRAMQGECPVLYVYFALSANTIQVEMFVIVCGTLTDVHGASDALSQISDLELSSSQPKLFEARYLTDLHTMCSTHTHKLATSTLLKWAMSVAV